MRRILFIEPPGGYIRLDRCMQSIDSWAGAYRFPLNLSRIAAHLMSLDHSVKFIDLQADTGINLANILKDYDPDLCILSSGFPSMRIDSDTAKQIKLFNPEIHVSTFGVVPSLLKDDFFKKETWGFRIFFDSVVVGGEPALGYESLLNDLSKAETELIYKAEMQDVKQIKTTSARQLFNHELYKSPFSGETATYIEGTYGCPYSCSFCVVPEFYNSKFSKRSVEDIVEEFKFVIERNGVKQITLWDEGTTFQKSFINELCNGLIELRKSNLPKFKNFVWTTRSTTALLDEEIVEKLAFSGLSGITLGIESFDANVLKGIHKKVSLETNDSAINLLNKYGIISIGHIILGHINDSHESLKRTIEGAISSKLDFAQFYCAVPYPGTELFKQACNNDLIRVNDLTSYELCNPIMDTLDGVSYLEVGEYRAKAIRQFWNEQRWSNLSEKVKTGHKFDSKSKSKHLQWGSNKRLGKVANLLEMSWQ